MKELWTCPQCGARLVSRNLWHSCGTFSLDDLTAGSDPGIVDAVDAMNELFERLGDVQVIPQKTRVVCVARVRFAGYQVRKTSVLLSFALRRWIESPRIVKTESFGPRWCAHTVRLRNRIDLDSELLEWLRESHDTVGLQSDLTQ